MGVHLDEAEVPVVGIGDMAVTFWNGLLMSNKIKLVAAFNHMHIFLDPNLIPKLVIKNANGCLSYLAPLGWITIRN